MSRRSSPLTFALIAVFAVLTTWLATGCEILTGSVPLSKLAGATTTTSFTLVVDLPGVTAAKFVLDGTYVGQAEGNPPTFAVAATPGSHVAKVKYDVGSTEHEVSATFVATSGQPAPTTSTTTPVPGPPGEIVVDTVAEIEAAVASATPGRVIRVADGEYRFDRRLTTAASGTAAAPITLRGSRAAILRTQDASDDYGLHITGDHWRIQGITVAHASKGIVLDGSRGTVLDGVEVFDIGAEAVHFRACSSDSVLRNSYIHDTGRTSPQYGEGVYVGSAGSNWSTYQCTDPVEGQPEGDNTERVLIEDNVFEDTPAEGADLKEGTDSGVLRRNRFRRTGASGANSADSAVDAKGNNWVIEDNVVSEAAAPWDDRGVVRPSLFRDGFQTHSVRTGYGNGNVLRRNSVTGPIPGFGIGLHPATTNVASCDNVASGAAQGLVGHNGTPAPCRAP